MNISIQPGLLSLEQLQAVHAGGVSLSLPEDARASIRSSAEVVQRAADSDAPVYGVNTGFGKLANHRISKEQAAALQLNLIRSHSAGVGEPLQPEVLRLMLALNAILLVGDFLYKISLPPYLPYAHLVVDYHFGFTRRALIGAGVLEPR